MKFGKIKLIIAFSLMLAFGFFLSEVSAQGAIDCGSGYHQEGDACVPDGVEPDDGGTEPDASAITIPQTGLPDPSGGIKAILTSALNWLLGIIGIIGIIGFAVSGVMYLISTGDETMIKRAKNGMLYSIVGIVVGLAGVILIQAIDTLLEGGADF